MGAAGGHQEIESGGANVFHPLGQKSQSIGKGVLMNYCLGHVISSQSKRAGSVRLGGRLEIVQCQACETGQETGDLE